MTIGGTVNDLGAVTIGRAMQLAAAVHDYDSAVVAGILTNATRTELHSVCVALAAMVDVDRTSGELLAWNDKASVPDPEPKRLQIVLQPHGTHSAFTRHKNRRETPCPPCIEGERTYQRLRKRRNRAEVAS